MERFLKLFLAVLKEMLVDTNQLSQELVQELKGSYQGLKKEEKDTFLKELLTYMNNDCQLYVFLLSFFLWLTKDPRIVERIQENLLGDELPFLDNLVVARQLRTYLFINNIPLDKAKNYEMQCKIHEKHVKDVYEALNVFCEYIPYEERNKKRIVLTISPLLSERHAPTRMMVNCYHYLQKLGYEVYVYATSHRWIEESKTDRWWGFYGENSICDESVEFDCKYYGIDVHGYHISYRDESYINEIGMALCQIAKLNPAFVMTIGECDVLADLCNHFTTVVTMGCVNTVPITIAPVVVNYFELNKAEEEAYQKLLKRTQKRIDMKIRCELWSDTESAYQREDMGLKEEDFVIIVAGNRLDDEVGEATKKLLREMLEENTDMKVVFIGECLRLQEELEKSKEAENYKFMGDVEDFKNAIGVGTVFLNPPRAGGGTGATFALLEEVPIITLGECDVASIAGDKFVCRDLQEMEELLHRYHTDKQFVETQKEYCRIRAKERSDVDSIHNLQEFCEEVVKHICNMENEQR